MTNVKIAHIWHAVRLHPSTLSYRSARRKTPNGRLRFGQCSRYLASLVAGDAITISVLASEMLLPPDRLAPVVLAGLGTGMAPFRAFIQVRIRSI